MLSRRVSLLMLSFVFFLLLAPAFFSPAVIAQETATGLDLRSVLPVAANGGVGVIMLIVIVVMARKDKVQNDEKMLLFTSQLSTQNETTKLAFEKYNEHTQQLIQLLKSSQEQNIQVHKDNQETTLLLTGTLSRLEVKLAHPVVCPIGEFQKMQREIQG